MTKKEALQLFEEKKYAPYGTTKKRNGISL